MGEIEEIETPAWLHLKNPTAIGNKKEIELELNKPKHGTIGKYLFFSDDKNLLINLSKSILVKYKLYEAKVSISVNSRSSSGFGFVLCIYDSKPKLKYELKKYSDEKNIRYRYWKYDTDTIDGKYSNEFIQSKKKE